MRRLFVAVTLCAAFLLLAAPAFAGLTQNAGQEQAAPAPHTPRTVAQLSRPFTPLGARLAGAVTVTGKVYDSSHSILSGVKMSWWSWSEPAQRWSNGSMTSRGDGSYSASPQPTGDGEIWAYPDDDTSFARLGQTWTAGPYPVDIYPGKVNVSATRDGPWGDFSSLTLNLWGEQAFSSDSRTVSDTTLDPATVQAEALDGTYDRGSVGFWLNEGLEFSTPLTVASGTAPSGTIVASEALAQRVQFLGYRFSGKPGATVTVTRTNFPTGWRNYVTGSSDPTGLPYKQYGTTISKGGTEPLNIKVPRTAKPGYSFWIGLQHIDASGDFQPLYVETAYQVCTMNPSKSSVTRNTRIRVSGVVPTQGHWGSKAGRRKAIVLWWHKGAAPVPTTWDPRDKGWVEVADLKTTGTGSYATPYFKVERTGTLVVQYDSDDWYFGGYTSTAKVTVR
jgi:hypothetical protein